MTVAPPGRVRPPDLEVEARLDPSITFGGAAPRAGPGHVLLTGATGFVGAFLLDELLSTTGAEISCLVRAGSTEAARARLVDNLRRYGLWRDVYAPRVRPVAGDLTLPRFGLGPEEADRLAHQVGAVYHLAGSIDALHSYARLAPVNVSGTKEVLRLAGTGTAKSVHFLSSMAVHFVDANVGIDRLYEDAVPVADPSLRNGYAQSKWVADRLVVSAQARGLPAAIYRCVRVMGHSRTGAMHEMHDILPLVLRACVVMARCPELDTAVTMVPVDYVSRAMAHLSRQPASLGRAFHLVTPRPIPWPELMAAVRACGYPLEEVPYDRWRREVRERASAAGGDRFFMTVLLALMAPHYLLYPRPPLDTSNVDAGLAGTGIACPPVDSGLVRRYVDYWRGSGYLPEPEGPRREPATAVL